jgi:hypothetical protein
MNFPVLDIGVDVLSLVLFQVAFLGKTFVTDISDERSNALMHPEVVQEIPRFDELFPSIFMSAYYNSPRSGRSTNGVVP